MITVGFESKRLFENLTGFGAYSRTLLLDLSNYYPNNRYFLFAHKSHTQLSKEATVSFPDIQKILDHIAVAAIYPPEKKLLYWKLFGSNQKLKSNNIDIYHGLTNQLPRSIRGRGIPKLLTIHDLIYRRYSEYFPGEDLEAYDRRLRKDSDRSEKIIAVSESTKCDIVEYIGVNPDKVTVIHQACDERYQKKVSDEVKQLVRAKYNLPDKYLLSVGSVTERKNLLSVIKAINLIPAADRLPLVVIGEQRKVLYREAIFSYIAEHGLEKWLIFPNAVTNDDLPAVYQGAEIFIYTSLYEGFGIPVLEALVSGVPVITSNVSGMSEAGGPDSRLVNPRNIDEISTSITELLGDDELRGEMIQKGYLHAARFSNQQVTTKLIDLYHQIIDID
jgi:glycosyltransferase involved in cell wall biosynthesis